VHKRLQSGVISLEMNFNAGLSVQYPSRERMGASQAVHKWAEAYPLDDTANFDGTGA
jgi:hypothetical protein